MKAPTKLTLLIALCFALGACSSNQPEANADQLNSGKEAPAFELMDLEGTTHTLSDYEGQKVYLKFWASWCSICLAGMQEVDTLAAEETDFAVLTIVSPGSNAEKNSKSFKKWFGGLENTANTKVLLDEGGAIFEEYGVIGYPTSVYIGSDGVLVKSSPGHFGNEQIKESFESIQ